MLSRSGLNRAACLLVASGEVHALRHLRQNRLHAHLGLLLHAGDSLDGAGNLKPALFLRGLYGVLCPCVVRRDTLVGPALRLVHASGRIRFGPLRAQ